MRRKLAWIVFFTMPVVMAAVYAGIGWATTASGFRATTLAKGRFGEIDVLNHFVSNDLTPRDADIWLSLQKTIGTSDVYVQSNVWDPGGSTGWHSHPGHSLIIVTTGAVTAYEGDDPNCKPTVYTTGMGFVDPGGKHVHILRNEGTVPAGTIAVQLIPGDAARRIDAQDPGNCHF